MENLLKNEFIHYGTNEIRKELWLNLKKDEFHDVNIKPTGGIWTSKLSRGLGDWIDYVKSRTYEWEDILQKEMCIIKFKEDTKLFKLDKEEDFNKYLKQGYIIKLSKPEHIRIYHYPIEINYILDYEKIIKDYNLLYINSNLSKDFLIFRVPTLLTLSPDNIEYYKKISTDLYSETYKELGTYKIKPYHKNYKLILEIIKEELLKYEGIIDFKILYPILKEKIKDIDIDVNKVILIQNIITNHNAKILTLKK